MVVNPLLRARGGYVNRILVVDTAVEVQIERTMERDKIVRKEAQAIVDSQLGRAGRLALAGIFLNKMDETRFPPSNVRLSCK